MVNEMENPTSKDTSRFYLYYKDIVRTRNTVIDEGEGSIVMKELYANPSHMRQVYIDGHVRDGSAADERVTFVPRPDGGNDIVFTDIPDDFQISEANLDGEIPVYVAKNVRPLAEGELFDFDVLRTDGPAGKVNHLGFFTYYPDGQPVHKQFGVTIGIGREKPPTPQVP